MIFIKIIPNDIKIAIIWVQRSHAAVRTFTLYLAHPGSILCIPHGHPGWSLSAEPEVPEQNWVRLENHKQINKNSCLLMKCNLNLIKHCD